MIWYFLVHMLFADENRYLEVASFDTQAECEEFLVHMNEFANANFPAWGVVWAQWDTNCTETDIEHLPEPGPEGQSPEQLEPKRDADEHNHTDGA